MALHERIRQLRLKQGWTQTELANKLSINQKQISSYERGVTTPSTEILIKLAESFDVTLDSLAFDSKGQPGKIYIQDRELLRRFEVIDTLPDTYRSLAREMLELLVLKHRFQALATAGPL